MTAPDGTALLAGATAEDLERDAAYLERLAAAHLEGREAKLRLAALARAVAKCERDGECCVEQSLVGPDRQFLFVDVLTPSTQYGGQPLLPALAALLGGSANG